MKHRANTTFAITGWEEKPYDECEGAPKLTRVSATKTYRGDIEGTGTIEYLMMYADEVSARFVGLERVVGRIGERSGTFTLQHEGTFEHGRVEETFHVLPGSASGDLVGLQGHGEFASAHAETYPLEMEFE
jgi:hypothetical protein